MTPGIIWLSVHSAVAIVSACLPTYRPLLARLIGLPRMGQNRAPPYQDLTRYPSTRRTAPSAPSAPLNDLGLKTTDNSPHSTNDTLKKTKYGRNSSEELWTPTRTSTDADIGLIPDFGRSVNGLTKNISLPSQSSQEGQWGPAASFGPPEGSKWPLNQHRPQTRRADLEMGSLPTKKSAESQEGRDAEEKSML